MCASGKTLQVILQHALAIRATSAVRTRVNWRANAHMVPAARAVWPQAHPR